jgi:parallel beta-helix repeat protein
VAINNFTLHKQGAEIGNAITTLPTTENYEFSGNRIDGFRTIFSLTGKNGSIRNNTINVAELGSALHFLYSSEQHVVEGNTMSSTSTEKGIILVGRNHQIRNNTFSDLSFGIRSANADSILIEGNTFYNNQLGIVIYGTSEQNRISQNSMYCNEAYQGIRLYADANNNKLPPVLTELTATTLTGTSLPGDTIEIYLSDNSNCDFDAPCQGKDYLGTTVADADGNWIYDNLELTGNEQLTALATDANNNSSSFADCMLYCAVVELSFEASATTICAGDRLVLRLTSDAYYEPDVDIGYFSNNVPIPLLGFSLSDSIVLYPEVTTTFTLAGVNVTTECEVTVNTSPYVVTVLEASALSEQIDLQLCAGESIEINGEMVSTPGVYHDTLTSVYGCDSLLEINLSVLPPFNTTAALYLCEGETTELFGNTVSEAGVYQESYISVAGCDSTHQVSVEIRPNVYTAVNTQICAGESVEIFGNMVAEAGVYEATFTGSNGCDSTHQITLEVLPNVTVETSLQICDGQSIELFGETVTTAGTYTGNFTAYNGCDSTHTVQVSVVDVITSFEERLLCPGGSILIAGEEIFESGTYEFMFTTVEGCDSILQVIVEDATIPMTESAVSICAGESIVLFGEEVAQAGSYTGTLTSSQGCDSIHTVQLSVLAPIETSETLQACTGQSIELFGNVYTTDVVASATFTSEAGCDSTHQVTLTFTEAITSAETMEICAGSEIILFGETVSEAGTYSGSFVTADGCDSIHQVTVTVSEIISTAETMEICAGSEIILFGETVSDAGTYNGSFVTADGCDSIHQVTVQVLEPVTNSASVVICEGETAMIFGEEQSTADVYTATFVGQNGCDSTQIIELEVLAPGFSESTLQICAGESVLLFGEIQTTAGTYEAHFTGTNGCDSTALVQLTVLETPQTEVQLTASCANESNGAIAISSADNDLTFTWSHTASDSNNLSDLSPGLYYLTVTNSNNCVEEMELEILALPLPDYEMTVTPISCSSLNSGMIQLTSNDSSLEVSINSGVFTNQLAYTDLSAGDYTLDIRTTDGCSQTELITLEPATNLTLASLEIAQSSCPGEADGSIALEMTGGNDGLQFLWQTGQVGPALENIVAGTYSVTVTNASGCQWEESFELTDLAPVDANLQLQLGCGDGHAFAIANPSAGQAPYELNWSTNQSGTIIANLTAGSYSVTLNDANGCTVVETFDIPYIAPFQIEEIVQDASCADSQDGSIELIISGGIPPYQINWNNGANVSTVSGLGVGTYSYNVSSGSCGLSAPVNISAPAILQAQVAFDLDAQNNLQAIALASGGTTPYSYQWSNGATGMMTTNLSPGQTITLTLTDANGCVFTEEFLVSLTSTDEVVADQFRIFPNPTSGQVFIEHTLGGALKYQLEIYHPAGAGLISLEEVTTPRHELSLQQLPAGVYLIVLSNEHFQRIARIVLIN